MLQRTLETRFAPGTNLKGNVTGANWTLLLPQLELGRTLCLGSPSDAALSMLAPLSHEVFVWEPHGGRRRRLARWLEQTGLGNVVLGARPQAVWQLNEQRVDLICHTEGRLPLRGIGEVQRLLRPNGSLYMEFDGSLQSRAWLRQLHRAESHGFDAPLWLWLTPLRGELACAVPLHDRDTVDYFVRHNHYAPSLQLPVVKRAERVLVRHGLGTRFLRRVGALVRMGSEQDAAAPPEYLRQLARLAGEDIETSRWGLWARGVYRSQKALFFLFRDSETTPRQVVKVTRDASFNGRLENEYRALQKLCEVDREHREHVPEALFMGHPGGLAVVGESMMEGSPFKGRTDGTATCRYARDAVDWLARLGASTAQQVEPRSVAQALCRLYDRFTSIYALRPEERAFLEAQIARIASSSEPFPAVFQHGDPGIWNMLVRPNGRVAFLDWEAAEQHGVPLWDLFYFLRSYAMLGRVRGVRSRLSTFGSHFLSESPLQPLLVEATESYCARVGLAPSLVEPLFYTCWMHRALKEANRLTPEELGSGNFIALLRLCIEQRGAPTLRRLFSPGRVNEQATAA